MSQTRAQSGIEVATNLLVGMLLNTAANYLFFPHFGWSITAAQNLSLVMIYTLISIGRQFVLRRCFNRWHR
jgi:hypothetical protein